ncbi:MAG: ABC transporter substrate-binding protein, partial [Methyloligellaceae bacterium]
MKFSIRRAMSGASRLLTVAAVSMAASSLAVQPSQAEDKDVKVGFVMFLSGAAAGPFGVPARNAAELMVESLNKGVVPAPYNSVGLAGTKISPVYVDEASKNKVADYKKLVEKDGVDLVIGYISSGSCKAIAPVAEEAKKLTILFDCGTPQIFEDIVTSPKYVFRTGGHATMDNAAAARYLLSVDSKAASIAGINQNYA